MRTPTSDTGFPPDRFVNRLMELQEREATGELAILRRNAGLSLAESRGALGIFYRLLPVNTGYTEEIYFLVATLYPHNTKSIEGENLGGALAKLKAIDGSEALDRRVAILLDSGFERGSNRLRPGELGFRLRQTIKLLASKEIGVDWQCLLQDLLRWDHPDRWVQKQWARAYFGAQSMQEEGLTDAS